MGFVCVPLVAGPVPFLRLHTTYTLVSCFMVSLGIIVFALIIISVFVPAPAREFTSFAYEPKGGHRRYSGFFAAYCARLIWSIDKVKTQAAAQPN